jgi:enoyl-CoA hydratase
MMDQQSRVTHHDKVLYRRDGGVVVITINRPDRMNAIGQEVSEGLTAAWDRFLTDDSAKVAVLTGAGDTAFCAGGDIQDAHNQQTFTNISDAELAAHARGEKAGWLGPSRWTDIYKPTIAAVNGVAYAGGLEWVCWTHLAIADEHASFGVTCRRWNLGLADGGTQRLPRIVGYRRALELIITGRVIDAAEALSIGLVNEVVPSGTCVDRAIELAHFISELPQPAISTDLEAVARGYNRPLEEGLRIEAECFNRVVRSPELADGLRRFNERDHPDRQTATARTPGLIRPHTG